MTDRPNFDELVGGDDLSPDEAARLQRVHDLLIEAGPPPELPPHLLQEPDPEGGRRDNVTGLPRRRTGMLLGIAAALTLTAFLGGFIYGTHHAPFNEDFAVPMHSTAAGSQAKARDPRRQARLGRQLAAEGRRREPARAAEGPVLRDVPQPRRRPARRLVRNVPRRGLEGRHPAERAVPPGHVQRAGS